MESENLELEIDKELEQEILYNAIEEDIDKELNKETLNSNNSKSKRKSSKKKNQKFVGRLKSRLQIKTVLILLLTLIVNTYAWFIYISTVSLEMSMHIKSWDFDISNANDDEKYVFTVEQLYPGMPEASEDFSATNNGEAAAKLGCEISSVQILDDVYKINTDYTDSNGDIFQYTSKDLLDKIMNDYPFKVNIYIDDVLYDGTQEIIMNTGDNKTITFKVVWPFETGTTDDEKTDNDAIDTEWGKKSYEYMQNPDNSKYCIKINLDIVAEQAEDSNDANP